MEKQQLEDIKHYMDYVKRYENQLGILNDAWEQIKILGEITCPNQAKTILPSMTVTQEGFQELKEKLIENLVMESVKKISLEMASKAQFVVDIVIRNLFERTADVGFLATDDDIRSFLLNKNPNDQDKSFIANRLNEYVKKYTVYDEIVILDKDLNVMVHLDENNPIDGIKIEDEFFNDSLAATKEYVETFGKSQLQPLKEKSLIYTSKIYLNNEPEAEAIGVLCLCFRFENEVSGVFEKLKSPNDPGVMLILDRDANVIASSDKIHVPTDIKVEMNLDEDVKLIYYRGLEYICKTTKTKGYQGFFGLGWYGHVMIPLFSSFKHKGTSTMDRIKKKVLKGVMDDSSSFSSSLFDIAKKAEGINMSLRRVVWNGQVMSEASNESMHSENVSLKSLLGQISRIGLKTSNLFEESIKNLYETVISSTLSDVQFIASLATDIMDRNLYERSNDCRWWALTSDFRRILSKSTVTNDDRLLISDILTYINSLYTVYTNLFVYDHSREIIAVSNSNETKLVGKRIDKDWAIKTLSIKNSQQYSVSAFENTDLYSNNHTYIYGASITDIENNDKVVGGIGIVFDSKPQFRAMLEDSLPKKEGNFALFLDREGTIISSTNPKYEEGTVFPIEQVFLNMPNGSGTSDILIHEGAYYAIGSMTSSGYREYKNTNDYTNDVIALTFVKLGEVDNKEASKIKNTLAPVEYISKMPGTQSSEIATFVLNNRRYGIFAYSVVEAISCEGLTPMPGAKDYIAGSIAFHEGVIQIINIKKVFGLEQQNNSSDMKQIIVVKSVKGIFGFLIDDLDDVLELTGKMLEDASSYVSEDCGYVKKIVDLPTSKGKSLMMILDPDKVLEKARQVV